MSIMFLDMASIPDFEMGARLHGLHDLSDKDIARVMSTKNREKPGEGDELGQDLHQMSAMSVLLLDDESINLQTSGGSETDELQHLKFMASIIDRHKPEVITWDRRKVLPLLSLRCLSNKFQLPFSSPADITDLKAEICGSEDTGSISLQEIASLSSLPGYETMSDESVLNTYLEGGHELIRINLELSVINTHLIYQRWQLVRGKIDQSGLEEKSRQLNEYLLQHDQTHLTDFVKALN